MKNCSIARTLANDKTNRIIPKAPSARPCVAKKDYSFPNSFLNLKVSKG